MALLEDVLGTRGTYTQYIVTPFLFARAFKYVYIRFVVLADELLQIVSYSDGEARNSLSEKKVWSPPVITFQIIQTKSTFLRFKKQWKSFMAREAFSLREILFIVTNFLQFVHPANLQRRRAR